MKTTVDAVGTVHVNDLALPASDFASREAKEEFLRIRSEVPPYHKEFTTGNIVKLRELWDLHDAIPSLERAKSLFPVEIRSIRIGGVAAAVVTPANGVPAHHASRVLINLHGGGFIAGGGARALLEAVPIASLANIKVITLDYRMAPEHIFPAASEDVAAAYRELLADYRPENIGIYGCSVGGTLAAESIAWFDRHGLPLPGAIAMICSNAARMGNGDSIVLGRAFGTSVPQPENMRLYFDGSDPNDPLVSPCASVDLLKKFPPTLLLSAGRDFCLSYTTYMHIQLVKAGVDARLFVWEGLSHGFVWSPDLPEAREAYDILRDFFATRLGARRSRTGEPC